jgi:hypothetical protein
LLFRWSDLERLKTHRPAGRAPEPVAPPTPSSQTVGNEVAEQALLMARFAIALEKGEPGPCPVCGEVIRPASWPAHLLGHRQADR